MPSTPDRLSLASRVKLTSALYHPLVRSPATEAAVVGAVRSIWMPLTVVVVLLPALSVQVAVADRLPPSPVTIESPGWAAGPDNGSVQVQSTVTSPVCHPLENEPLSTGAVLSMLMPETVSLAELPAASVAVPVTDWLAPSASTLSAVFEATPDRSSVAVKLDRDVVAVPASRVGRAVRGTGDASEPSCRCSRARYRSRSCPRRPWRCR